MIIKRTPRFKKSFKERIRTNPRLVEEFQDTLELFIEDHGDSVLGDHALVGTKAGLRAFSVTEDIRVVYKRTRDGIILYDIGTHDQIY